MSFEDEYNQEKKTDAALKQYDNFHIEMPYQIGIGKIYDPILIESQRKEPYFAKEYELKATGVGNRVFPHELLQHCIQLGKQYDPNKVSYFTPKYMGCDPAWRSSKFGIVINEVDIDGNIRVLFADHFERKNTQFMIDKILDLRIKYRNIQNIFIDVSQSEFIVDLKGYFESMGYEYTDTYTQKIREWAHKDIDRRPWEMGMYVIPATFGSGGSIRFTQRLKKAMSNGNYWLNEQFDKLILAYDTAVQKELDENDIDKDHTENNDILDAQKCIFERLRPI
jgi:hypothetical protein